MRRPINTCSYKGLHTAHDWQAAGGYYEYHCRGLDELDVGATARQREIREENCKPDTCEECGHATAEHRNGFCYVVIGRTPTGRPRFCKCKRRFDGQ